LFSHLVRVGSQHTSTEAGRENTVLRQFRLLRFSTHSANGKSAWGGKWLEKWEFHRLPELWNVLIGDLRFIGVKPLSVDEAGKITEKWQQKRNEYASGFTGLWYIQTRGESTLDEVLIADAYYVATRTWREDVRLFWQTIPTWWRRARR
jgi:lipopolysaccharide/colanic/teichoic acid biosynthesis glycosyltransferase